MAMAQPKDANAPAALVLNSDDRRAFLIYLDSNGRGESKKFIRNALDFQLFREYRLETETDTDNLDNQDASVMGPAYTIATKCNHPLHPATAKVCDYCPVCEVSMCLNFLDIIQKAWGQRGGPWKLVSWNPKTEADSRAKVAYIALKQSWRRAKLELLRVIAVLRSKRKKEQRWEQKYPEGCISEVYAAAKAMKQAKYQAGDPTPYGAKDFKKVVPRRCLALSKQPKSQHPMKLRDRVDRPIADPALRFAIGVRARTARKRMHFHRPSAKYKPGKFSPKIGHQRLDTSFYRSPVLNILHLKVIKVTVQERGGSLEETVRRDGAALSHSGTVDSHPLREAILEAVDILEHTDGRLWQALCTHATAIFVGVRDNEVISILPNDPREEELENWVTGHPEVARWATFKELRSSAESSHSS